MVTPYSVDLRKKVVEVFNSERISKVKLAKRFQISLSSVKRYLNLEQEIGDLSPKVGGGRPGKITDSGYKTIQKIIEEKPTITLEELSSLLYKKKKITAGRSILSRACQKLNLRRKKLSKYAAEQEREDVKKNSKFT
jgi:transposase